MSDVVLLARAFRFASERHKDQHRKGEDNDPYVNHLAEVAELVATCDARPDAEVVAAALLHDTVEDTGTTSEELARLFGRRVADLVAEVTDDKSLPKHVRKARQIEHAPQLSREARLIKIADKTSNVRSVTECPPADWPEERRRDYVLWGRAVVDRIRGTDAALEAAFDAMFAAAARRFDIGP